MLSLSVNSPHLGDVLVVDIYVLLPTPCILNSFSLSFHLKKKKVKDQKLSQQQTHHSFILTYGHDRKESSEGSYETLPQNLDAGF